jgi:hypothetical protein
MSSQSFFVGSLSSHGQGTRGKRLSSGCSLKETSKAIANRLQQIREELGRLKIYCMLEHTSEHDKSQKDETLLHEDNTKLDRTVVYIALRCLYPSVFFSLVVDQRQYFMHSCEIACARAACLDMATDQFFFLGLGLFTELSAQITRLTR